MPRKCKEEIIEALAALEPTDLNSLDELRPNPQKYPLACDILDPAQVVRHSNKHVVAIALELAELREWIRGIADGLRALTDTYALHSHALNHIPPMNGEVIISTVRRATSAPNLPG